MSSNGIRFERRDRVGWIVLDRPDRLNALAGDMRQEIRRRIVAAADAPDIHSLVVVGEGRAFCAGGDVEAMSRLHEERDHSRFHAIVHAGSEVVLALQAFPGLTVAAINGVAAGAGLGLALSCDLRIAARGVELGATWGRLALLPDWGASFWLPRLIGLGPATDLVMSGRMVSAEEALEMGLVHRLVEADELAERAQEAATRYAGSRRSILESRALLRAGVEGSLEAALARESEAQEERFLADDVAEGLSAFLEKRPPEFDAD